MYSTQTSARRPPTLRPGQPTWAASPPVGCYNYSLHTSSPFSITQLESWYSFYRPTEGGRLSQHRHTARSPIVLHCTWVWETCTRFLHDSNLAGNRTSYLRYASPMLYQQATEPPECWYVQCIEYEIQKPRIFYFLCKYYSDFLNNVHTQGTMLLFLC